MDRSEMVIFTNMCMVYDNKGNVLVQDRADKEWGGITFPGGHVEREESFADAVIREVYEETGLRISFPRLCGIKQFMTKDGIRYVVLLYKTDKFSGNLTSSTEGEVFWTGLNELNGKELAEGMENMLQVFLEDDLSEIYWYKVDGVWRDELK